MKEIWRGGTFCMNIFLPILAIIKVIRRLANISRPTDNVPNFLAVHVLFPFIQLNALHQWHIEAIT